MMTFPIYGTIIQMFQTTNQYFLAKITTAKQINKKHSPAPLSLPGIQERLPTKLAAR